MTESFTFAIEQ